jgi:hypothetical protein
MPDALLRFDIEPDIDPEREPDIPLLFVLLLDWA